jgi:hypothetical protein
MSSKQKYVMEVIENNKSKNGKLKRKTIRMKAKNNNPITFEELNDFYNGFIERGEDPNKISISGMNADRYITMKGFDDPDLRRLDLDEYYVNRTTNNVDKFESFFFVDFYFK